MRSEVVKARQLMKDLRAHRVGAVDFMNTVGAVYGWSSTEGRIVQSRVFRDFYYAEALEDLPDVFERHERDGTPSAASKDMATHAVLRQALSRRLLPLTLGARTAAVAYLQERYALLDRVDQLLEKYPATSFLGKPRQWAERDRKQLGRLMASLTS